MKTHVRNLSRVVSLFALVLSCSYLLAQDITVQTQDAAGPGNLGSISLTINSVEGLPPTPPFEVSWTGPSGPFFEFITTMPYVSEIDDLLPGQYCVTIIAEEVQCTDGEPAEASGCFTVEGNSCSTGWEIQASSMSGPICSGQEGFINIFGTSVDPCFDNASFNIIWDNGDMGPSIDGLAPGQYCVTYKVVSGGTCDGCFTVKCFEIEQLDDDGPIDITADIVDACEYVREYGLWDYYCFSCGSITLNISGGAGPYEVYWEDGNQSNPRYGVRAQTYCVMIIDACGTTYYDCFDVPCDWDNDDPKLPDALTGEEPEEAGGRSADDKHIHEEPALDEMPLASFTIDHLKAYPNPFNHSLTVEVEIPQAGTYHVRFFDLAGRQIQSFSHTLSKGENQLVLDTDAIPDGAYIMELRHQKQPIASRVKVLKLSAN